MEERPKVTACLITWKRQYNLPKIVESLSRWDFIDEIIIRDNSKSENIINYARYEAALGAKNDLVYFQDDDWLINNVDEIYEAFLKDPTKMSHSGSKGYEEDIPNETHGEKQMGLVGWGAIVNRKWFHVLDLYIRRYGMDYCFYRETDRLFTLLLNQHHTFVHGDPVELEGSQGEGALHLRDDHMKYKNMARERGLAL